MKVLVTGASRGIGKAIASIYRSKGYSVETPSREILDLADADSVAAFINTHDKDGYDIIINNAGCNLINPIDNIIESDINQMMQVNLLSPIIILRGFVPYMKRNRFGRIVNIGSIWGAIAKPGRSVYSATKHGIHGITSTLAVELASYNILVNTVAPGQTLTELTLRNNSPEEIREMEGDIPVGRLAQPEEVARLVFFLGNEENTYITGQQIIIDGGLTLK